MGDEFIPCQATIGVDFTYVESKVKDDEDPNKMNKISLQIWDMCKYIIIYNTYFLKKQLVQKDLEPLLYHI